MTLHIAAGWWILPAVMSFIAWWPVIAYRPQPSSYGPDLGMFIFALISALVTAMIWMVYFGIRLALS